MTMGMWIAIILCIALYTFFSILCVFLSSVCCVLAVKAVKANFEMQNLMNEYAVFFDSVAEVVASDTDFLKSELARTLKSDEIASVRELSQGLTSFQNKIIAIRDTATQLAAASSVYRK